MTKPARSRKVGGSLVRFTVLLYLFPLPGAVSLNAQPQTRADQIRKARQQKASRLEPEKTKTLVQRMNALVERKVLEGFLAGGRSGFQPIVLGGTRSGQGQALGIGYRRRDLARAKVDFRTSARATLSGGYLFDLQFVLPKLANGKLFFDFLAVHENSPRMDYYGPGSDSDEGSRTSYRLEDTSFDFTLGVMPLSVLRLGVSGGYLNVNTGPGTRSGVPSIEEIFDPATTPGIDHQPAFLRGSGFLELDYRDNSAGPRSGGYYSAKFLHYKDLDFHRYSHRRLDLDVQQFIPYFNKRHTLALRVFSVLSFPNRNQTVPFYLQPTLGSSHSLRGFERYRFYDDNAIHVSAEHRWESFAGLDMALFFDAGKVTPKHSQVNFKDLETLGIRVPLQCS